MTRFSIGWPKGYELEKPIQTSDLPATRKEALRYGKQQYLSGMPCKRGHENPPRYAGTGNCVLCTAARQKPK